METNVHTYFYNAKQRGKRMHERDVATRLYFRFPELIDLIDAHKVVHFDDLLTILF